MQVDYSENYVNKDQGQIQSAYFRQSSFSIFRACCYVNIDSSIINENFTITSEANDHSRSAAMSCWMRVLSCIQEKYDLAESLRIHIQNDGCAGQFRSRFVFILLSWFFLEHKIFWYYNERHHGKGPMDGVGGTIKHWVFRDVKTGKVVIKDAKHFSTYAGSTLKGITSLYMPIEEILEEPKNVISSPQISGTLKVQKIAHSFTNNGVCKLEFFRTAANSTPFHEQWYKKEGYADVCGHDELPLAFKPDQTCSHCHGIYVQDQEWMECNLCDQWFHEEYFFI